MSLSEKSVLITGAGGFIGSHLVEALLREGCRVRAFVHYNAFNRWGWLDSFPEENLKRIDVFSGDISDPSGVRTAMGDCQVVFHLAALIGIPFSYHSPGSYVQTNVGGTLNVLQAARDLGVEKVLVTSTSEVYGTAREVPITEAHPRQGQSPYSATKIAADALAESFYRSFDLPVAIVRPFNTYGPRQSARAIIPTIITQLLAGAEELRLGALHPTRDFVFVEDTVRAFVEIAKSGRTVGRDINIASGREISVGELAQRLAEMLRPETRIVRDAGRLRPEKSEVERLAGSARLLEELTGWQPAVPLEDGLKRTVDWFRGGDHLRYYKPGIYHV